MIIMVMGLPGSGKSFFATKLAALLDAKYISSDQIRMEKISDRTYSDREKEWVYDEMLNEMVQIPHMQNHVVLDATFYSQRLRNKFLQNVNNNQILASIEIWAREAIVKSRLSHRRELSEAGIEIYQLIKSQWEPIREKHLTLESTQGNLHIMLQKAIQYLHTLKNDQ